MVAKQKGSTKKNFSIATLACGIGANKPRPPLFEAILRCDWVELHDYLTTGSFQNADKYGDTTMLPALQGQKWVSYYDSYTHEKVRQRPLHAAISHLAPLPIVQRIFDLYQEAIQCPDSNGNLPLHLAFTTNAKDVSSFLLKAYPEALMVANDAGNLPIECYHHIYLSIAETIKTPKDTAEFRKDNELFLLEQKVAKDEQRMAAAVYELQNIKEDFRRIQNEGRRRLLQLTEQAYTNGTVEL